MKGFSILALFFAGLWALSAGWGIITVILWGAVVFIIQNAKPGRDGVDGFFSALFGLLMLAAATVTIWSLFT